MAAGLFIARLIIGLGLASHGAQKLFGWFGGHGIQGTGGAFAGMGFRPGVMFAVLAGLGEFVGGLLVALGWLGGVGPEIVTIVMLVAILSVHLTKGFFTANGGRELPALYIAGALALAFGGFGAYSLDAVAGVPLLSERNVVWWLELAAVIIALLTFVVRRKEQQSAA